MPLSALTSGALESGALAVAVEDTLKRSAGRPQMICISEGRGQTILVMLRCGKHPAHLRSR